MSSGRGAEASASPRTLVLDCGTFTAIRVIAFRLAAFGFAARPFAGAVNTPQRATSNRNVHPREHQVKVFQVPIVPLVLFLGGVSLRRCC